MIVRLRNRTAGATVSAAAADNSHAGRKVRPGPTPGSENGSGAMIRKMAGSVPPTGARANAAHAPGPGTTSAGDHTGSPRAAAGDPPPNAATGARRGSGNSGDGTTTGAEPRKPRQSLWFRPGAVNVKLIYAGYLASLAMPPVALIAGFFAYQNARQDPPQWLATHYLYQVRTFWMGFAANLVAYALSFAGVGLLLFPLIAVWLVARAVKGLIRVAQGVEIEEPLSFFV